MTAFGQFDFCISDSVRNLAVSTTANAAAAPHPLSIGDALLALKAWTDWPAKQQADATAALNKIVRQDGRPAGTIPFTPAVVRTTILTRKPAVLGVTSGSKYTIASRIRHVMKRLDLIDAEDTPAARPGRPSWLSSIHMRGQRSLRWRASAPPARSHPRPSMPRC
jgi:hypothetical protein